MRGADSFTLQCKNQYCTYSPGSTRFINKELSRAKVQIQSSSRGFQVIHAIIIIHMTTNIAIAATPSAQSHLSIPLSLDNRSFDLSDSPRPRLRGLLLPK
jgi:hypothetical protein